MSGKMRDPYYGVKDLKERIALAISLVDDGPELEKDYGSAHYYRRLADAALNAIDTAGLQFTPKPNVYC